MEPLESARKILQIVRPGTSIEFQQENEKQICREKLINRLNYVNFQDGTVLVNFRHSKYAQIISLEAKPLPCQDDWLDCTWSEEAGTSLQKVKAATFENFFVIDGHKLVVVEPTVTGITENGISFRLPDTSSEMSYRKVRRHLCVGIAAQLMQNSALFHGTLLDFNSISFRIEAHTVPPQTFHWIDPELPVGVVFSRGEETLFSGACRIIKQSSGGRVRTIVLEPVEARRPRFRAKTYRSTRQMLAPSPNAIFQHPFTGRTVDLKVVDISGTGFSVEEAAGTSVLTAGLIISDLELSFANSFSTRCKAQVVYREVSIDDEHVVKCGLTILDMDVQDHLSLLALLYQANDRNTYLSSRVDMEKLWQFFFETGFIYPKKYAFIKSHKEVLRRLYEKLYTESPRIARHFIYQEKGVILGHMAMVRFYENSWLIHHHAASRGESNRAGLVVLNQIGRFINDSHRLYSIHMDYVFCYYRPDNKFPHRVFGGVSRHIKDKKASSLDPMAYLHFTRDLQPAPDFSGSWQLTATTKEDLLELESFYENQSGGLMLDALDLEASMSDGSDISREYRAADFRRERHLFSLKRHDTLVAVVQVVLSDVGLNMSDLTNCITVIVISPEDLSRTTLSCTLSILLTKFKEDEMPVLLYPVSYAESNNIPFEKIYNLWVLSMQHTDKYFGFLDRLLKSVKH